MRYLLCVIISYLIGTFNPSYIVGVKKSINVKEKGSKNAGASNALILFGKVVGVVCALLDIGKACLAIALCRKIFSGLSYVFAIAGTSCIIGHIFPFYLKFKGGKGLACLGGVVLMFDFRYFLLLLAAELVIALATDYICFVPITASVIFPVSYGILRGDVIGALILGMGMSLAMTDIGKIIGLLGGMAMLIGILIGIIGIVLVSVAYPIYNSIIKKEREKIAPEIIRLTDELMK